MNDRYVMGIVKEPNAAPTIAQLPASRAALLQYWESPSWSANRDRERPASPAEFANTWGRRLLEVRPDRLTVYRHRPLEPKPSDGPLLLYRESQADFSPLNITLPMRVHGTIAIVNQRDSESVSSLRDEEFYAWLQWAMLVDARVTEGDAIYSGVSEGIGYDRVYVERTEAETRRRTRMPLKHYARHSRVGFSWGHMGDGPADLALALLVDVLALSPRDNATFPEIEDIYQAFKSDVVSHLAKDLDGWRLRRSDILRWLHEYPPHPVCAAHGIARRRSDGRCEQCDIIPAESPASSSATVHG